jgi:hypothetical protein
MSIKKIAIIVFFLFFCLLFKQNIVYGQSAFNIQDNIPGVTCGIAGDTTGKDRCCNIQSGFNCDNEAIQFAGGLLQYVPIIRGYVAEYKTNCTKVADFVRQTNNNACISGSSSTSNFADANCKCIDPLATANANTAVAEMCYKYLGSSSHANELNSCLSCSTQNGMWTGMGCLPLDINSLISGFILNTGIGLGGGFALLCIIYAAFLMQSSQGNPEKLKKAQEMITSCIMGLMLIIFSVFIMRLIGVNILRIPGFG